MSFLVPDGSGEKVGLTIIIFLSFTVFQSYLNGYIPISFKIPLINIYIVAQLVLSAFCVVTGVISLLLRATSRKMSASLNAATFKLAHYLCIEVHDYRKRAASEDTNALQNGLHYITNLASALASNDQEADARSIQCVSLKQTMEPADSPVVRESDADGRMCNNFVRYSQSISNASMLRKLSGTIVNGNNETETKDDWVVLNEVLSRIFLMISLTVILALTLYFVLATVIDGPL
jgi:hypothetical protein